MIRTAIRSVLLLLTFTVPALIPAVTPALAQSERPALRATVTVAGDVVRIGDLIENAGPVADIPVFRAPDLGTTGAVSTDRVIEAIRPHQLIDIDTRGLAEVVVTHASRTITAQDISDRIARVLSTQYQLGDAHDISLNFDMPVHPLEVEARARATCRCWRLTTTRAAAALM